MTNKFLRLFFSLILSTTFLIPFAQNHCLTVGTKAGPVRIKAVADDILRISALPSGEFPADASLMTIPVKYDGNPEITRYNEMPALMTAKLIAAVDTVKGTVTIYDRSGRKLLDEDASRCNFTPVTVEGTEGYTVTRTFNSLNDNEGIYGLGQHQANEFNYKRKNEELFQYNTKVSVPFIVSTDNYGILWDSYSFCRWGRNRDYSQLDEIFTLYNKEGRPGALTGTYCPASGDTIVRDEPQIYFEHLSKGDLDHVAGLPRDFKFNKSTVVYEGEIVPEVSGTYDFILYYSGYQTVYIGDEKVVDTRWRTAWNPNSFKFCVNLEKGKRTPIRIEWEPNGSVAYCGLRAMPPVDDSEAVKLSWWGEMQDMADYYFIHGSDMDDVISGYRTLTGKAPIMPRWAMGYWQSREKYNTADEVLSTVTEYRRRNIPLDNIVIDWLHWPQDAWGSHEFDRKRFPDPKGMVDSIHAMNARVMVSVWPKFYTTTEHFKEFDSHGWMYRGAVRDSIRDWVGKGYLGSFYDAYNPDARRLFWSQINDHYVPLGIDAWWMDASEPNIRDCIPMDYRKELMTPTYLGPSTKYFNAYALANAEAIYDGQRGVDPDRRVFLLTRSGYAGQQRYSTATWSGDIATRWEDMESQISAGLNFALSGIPFWTMDIGGFCVEDRYVKAMKQYNSTGNVSDDLDEWRELNTRWYQFGAFAPLFRSHGQWPCREIYNIAPENHPAYESMVRYTRIRYRLMPYIYSLNAMTHFDDYTIMRPMVMDFTSDTTTFNIKDQYMFGPALLVAPVYHYGARTRRVYLPSESLWYDFHTDDVVETAGEIVADAPYGDIPIFVRAGSIIPEADVEQYAEKSSDAPLTINIYGGSDGCFTLYEDENVNYNYEKGLFSKIRFTYDDDASSLCIAPREGQYPGMTPHRTFTIRKISSDNTPVETTILYDGSEAIIKL